MMMMEAKGTGNLLSVYAEREREMREDIYRIYTYRRTHLHTRKRINVIRAATNEPSLFRTQIHSRTLTN